MKVASIVNYKGGVGKTTLTANIGAELSQQGKRVLLLDLDPQASLTLSFYEPEEWRRTLAPARTIRQWYEARRSRGSMPSLMPFVTWPEPARFYARGGGGELGLVASDLLLSDVEEQLAIELGHLNSHRSRERYLRVFGRIAEGLESIREAYDFVLIDCPPNFGIITRSAVIASDGILIPARPEILSTFAIDHLMLRLNTFKEKYYTMTGTGIGERPDGLEHLAPAVLGVVFTQVYYGGGSSGPNPRSHRRGPRPARRATTARHHGQPPRINRVNKEADGAGCPDRRGGGQQPARSNTRSRGGERLRRRARDRPRAP